MIPAVQGEPMESDGEGTSTFTGKTENVPVVNMVRNPDSSVESTYFDQLIMTPDRYEVTLTAGTCIDSDGECTQNTSCGFLFKLICKVTYIVSEGFDDPPLIDPDLIVAPTWGIESAPWAGETTITNGTPEITPGLFPGSYNAKYEVTFETTIEPGCGLPGTIAINWGTNFDVSAAGGSPGSNGGNNWEVNNDDSEGFDGTLEEEVSMECAPCCGSTTNSVVTQSTGKNTNVESLDSQGDQT